MNKRAIVLTGILAMAMTWATLTHAEEAEVISVTIKNHKFIPDRIEVPSGKPFILMVKNDDPTPEEFESKVLHKEKVIPGNKSAKIKFNALKPGEYPFVGEYHEDVTKGVIVVK